MTEYFVFPFGFADIKEQPTDGRYMVTFYLKILTISGFIKG